ncbi:MAG: hypothetical protein CMB13_06605 [Euryarchaeota archaeon]|nr:hypothetical protein [Euryarchaeota archaeon]
MDWDISRDSWSNGSVLFWILSTWFGANLILQAAWMGLYGVPLDAQILFEAFGPYAWWIAGIEVFLWTILLIVASRRLFSKFRNSSSKHAHSRAVEPA